MRPFLVLDCYLDKSGCGAQFVPLPGEAEAHVVRSVYEATPSTLENYAGLIISGSAATALEEPPWLDAVRRLLDKSLEAQRPIFGVCFGHQLLAQAVAGKSAVRLADQFELGWFDIEVTEQDPLFEGLAPRFRTFLSHFDEVDPSAEGIEILAHSERCPVQALRVPGTHSWGVQFHAEMDAAETERLVIERSRSRPELGLDADLLLSRAVDSSALKQRLFQNFLDEADRLEA